MKEPGAAILELELAERQGKLISVREADRRVVKVRRNAPFITVDMNEDSTYTVAVSANDGIAFVRTADAESAQKLKSLLAKS